MKIPSNLGMTVVTILAFLTLEAQAEIVTVWLETAPTSDGSGAVKTLEVGTNQVVTVIGLGSFLSPGSIRVGTMWRQHLLEMASATSPGIPTAAAPSPYNFVLRGPCTIGIELTTNNTTTNVGFCTLKIDPEPTHPGKTEVIPAGQGGKVTLEASTNLVDWVPADPGLYTNVPSMKFFRVNVERVP